MKITIYELLGLIKDGKAPKKIKYEDNVYYLGKNMVDLHAYQTEGSNTTRKLSLIIDNEYLSLNDEVEIIEESKKIEKLPKGITDNACATKDQRTIANKINEIIDEINNLKEND